VKISRPIHAVHEQRPGDLHPHHSPRGRWMAGVSSSPIA